MLNKVIHREHTWGLWRVGESFSNKELECFEIKIGKPIENQRYAIERFEVSIPQNAFDKVRYLIQYGLQSHPKIFSCYHPLPEDFNKKEPALIFQKYWNQLVSPGEVVFLKNEKGKAIVEKFGRTNFMRAHKRNIKICK